MNPERKIKIMVAFAVVLLVYLAIAGQLYEALLRAM